MTFEAMAPAHHTLSILGYSFEGLVGISSHVMASGEHYEINESDIRTSSKSPEIKKEHQLKEPLDCSFTKRLYDTALGK